MDNLLKNKNDYTVKAFHRDNTPYYPKSEVEKSLVQKLTALKFKPNHIRVIFESVPAAQIILEIEEVKMESRIDPNLRPGATLAEIFKNKFNVQFQSDTFLNHMEYVHNLKKHGEWLSQNYPNWTYMNVYARRDKNSFLGRYYAGDSIPRSVS